MGYLLTAVNINQDQSTLIEIGTSWAKNLNKINHFTYVNQLAGGIELSYLAAVIDSPVIENAQEDILNADKQRVNKLIPASYKDNCKGFALAGQPADTLEKMANSGDYEMLILGHDFEKYQSEIFTSSTTDKLTRASKKPLLIARNDKAVNPKSIVGLIDFSHDIEFKIKHIAKLAKAFDAEITLINITPHYLNNTAAALTANTGLNAMLKETESKAAQHAKEQFTKIISGLQKQEIKAKSVILKQKESVAHTLKEYLNNNSYDLVMMGAHAPNILERFFIGSISYEIIHNVSNNIYLIK